MFGKKSSVVAVNTFTDMGEIHREYEKEKDNVKNQMNELKWTEDIQDKYMEYAAPVLHKKAEQSVYSIKKNDDWAYKLHLELKNMTKEDYEKKLKHNLEQMRKKSFFIGSVIATDKLSNEVKADIVNSHVKTLSDGFCMWDGTPWEDVLDEISTEYAKRQGQKKLNKEEKKSIVEQAKKALGMIN